MYITNDKKCEITDCKKTILILLADVAQLIIKKIHKFCFERRLFMDKLFLS